MEAGRRNPDFMCYFPDIFFKRNLPKEYFWKVYSTVEPNTFKDRYDRTLDRIHHKIRRPQKINITEEHRRIMNTQKDDNMKLSMALKKTGVAKNIIYLKKANRSFTQRATQENNPRPENGAQNVIEREGDDSIFQSEMEFE